MIRNVSPARTGTLMAIRDHFEWNRPYAWRQAGPGGIGPEGPSPYSPVLLTKLDQAARRLNVVTA